MRLILYLLALAAILYLALGALAIAMVIVLSLGTGGSAKGFFKKGGMFRHLCRLVLLWPLVVFMVLVGVAEGRAAQRDHENRRAG